MREGSIEGTVAGPLDRAEAPARQERAGTIPRAELVVLAAVVGLAAVLRFVNLPARGIWDTDQGTHMMVLWSMVHDGAWPLLGPSASMGGVHHGALYYYLLAPIAFLSGADPVAIVAFIALVGVGAVAAVWWLARSVGGPVAGIAAGGFTAVSATAIEGSTFIWNPNLVLLSSALTLAAAWHAWTSGRSWWWIVAAGAQSVTMHCHIAGAVMLVPLGALLVADARRRTSGQDRRRLLGAAAAGMALIAITYVPLLVHELRTDFSETRALFDYVAGGGEEAIPLAVRGLVVPLRILSWPLTGLITSQPIAGILAAVAVAAILGWRVRASHARERVAARWFSLALVVGSIVLVIGAPSLARVVLGLPNDHYHAFLDPIVYATVGLGAAALWQRGRIARAATVLGLGALVALNVAIWPPAVASDGGYPQAERAAQWIAQIVGDRPFELDGLPTLKNENAYAFPLLRLGHPPTSGGDLVMLCDRLLEPMIESTCGGPAEAARIRELGDPRELVERFDASDRTVVSIYR